MFTQLLVAAALTPGQVPASPPGAAPVYYPIRQPATPPANLPMTAPTPTQPAQPPAGNGDAKKNGDGDKKNGNGDDEKKDEDKKEDDKKEPEKYLLERTLAQTRLGDILTQRGITVYGWTDMSYNASTASKNNAPVYMIDQANQFLLNQNYLVMEKTLDTSKKEFQWGWRTDWVLPGSDARTSIVRGLWDSQLRRGTDGGPILYPIDLYQVYGQAYLPDVGPEGTTVKLGRFATHCEYELFQAVDRPFVSTSYLFQYNPFTHTGVWATTPLNDTWTMSHGFATGNDTFFDRPTNRLTYLGQLKWAPKDGKTTVLLNAVVTNPQYKASENFTFYNVYNLQVTHKFNDKVNYVLDAAYSHTRDVPGYGFSDWYGVAQYLYYNHTDKLTSCVRAEVFDDPQGFRTGFAGMYTELTYGLAYKARQGLILRPSIRYDNNSRSAPWEGSQNLFTAAMEVIMRW